MTDSADRQRREIPNTVLIRDVLIFQLKLWLDGFKDLVLSPLSIGAAILDLLSGPGPKGYRLYRVLRRGERFDLWLNLYRGSGAAESSGEGLFGGSEPGDDTMLGRLESMVDADRVRRAAGRRAAPPHDGS